MTKKNICSKIKILHKDEKGHILLKRIGKYGKL
nr:MAG TPA: hypothetical protein [Caudoviricetes sp.]